MGQSQAGEAWAMVLVAPRRLERRVLPRPRIGPGEGLLRVEACGLCGTDHEQFRGLLPGGKPFVPGHEVVGVVEELGEGAAERFGVRVGQRVAVEVFQSCRRCPACRQGEAQRCTAHGLGDMVGFVPVERPPGLFGGYASHLFLGPDAQLLPVPEGLDPVLATLFNPLGAGIRWGADLPGVRAGEAVAVLGPGIRGLGALVAAKEAGAGFVAVVGKGPQDADRLAWARRFGADLTVDGAQADPVAELRRALGQGADVVVDVTAAAPEALGLAVALARPGGRVVLAGTRGDPATPGFHPDHLVYKELTLLGALGVDTRASTRALALVAFGRYPFAELPRVVRPTSQAGSLLETMAGETGARPVHAVVVPEERSGP
jgi:alcohol dehydrogenase